MFNFENLKRQILQNIASPYSLAILSYAGFLVAWLFPADLYTSLAHEPNLLFLDPLAFVYFTACVLAFLIGVRVTCFFYTRQLRSREPGIRVSNALLYLLTPLALSTAYCLWYLKELGARMPLLELLTTQQGALIKLSMMLGQLETGRSAVGLPVLIGTLWWATFRTSQINLRVNERCFVRVVLGVSTAVCIATCIARVDRTSLVAFVAGLVVVWMYRQSARGNIRFDKFLAMGAACSSVLPAAFVGLAVLRGADATRSVLESAVGYTIASYNRLAALLSGQMTYVYHGKGIYLAPYLLEAHKIDKILHITQNLGWPSFSDVFMSEFQSVSAAGLNPIYIWSGAFGYIYSDLGWGTLGYLFLLGALSGYAWVRFKAGGVFALVLYPWMMSCVSLWFAANYLVGFSLNGLLECSIGLFFWDKLMLHRQKAYSKTDSRRSEMLMASAGSLRPTTNTR